MADYIDETIPAAFHTLSDADLRRVIMRANAAISSTPGGDQKAGVRLHYARAEERARGGLEPTCAELAEAERRAEADWRRRNPGEAAEQDALGEQRFLRSLPCGHQDARLP